MPLVGSIMITLRFFASEPVGGALNVCCWPNMLNPDDLVRMMLSDFSQGVINDFWRSLC